jgi:hypothetical protein
MRGRAARQIVGTVISKALHAAGFVAGQKHPLAAPLQVCPRGAVLVHAAIWSGLAPLLCLRVEARLHCGDRAPLTRAGDAGAQLVKWRETSTQWVFHSAMTLAELCARARVRALGEVPKCGAVGLAAGHACVFFCLLACLFAVFLLSFYEPLCAGMCSLTRRGGTTL